MSAGGQARERELDHTQCWDGARVWAWLTDRTGGQDLEVKVAADAL